MAIQAMEPAVEWYTHNTSRIEELVNKCHSGNKLDMQSRNNITEIDLRRVYPGIDETTVRTMITQRAPHVATMPPEAFEEMLVSELHNVNVQMSGAARANLTGSEQSRANRPYRDFANAVADGQVGDTGLTLENGGALHLHQALCNKIGAEPKNADQQKLEDSNNESIQGVVKIIQNIFPDMPQEWLENIGRSMWMGGIADSAASIMGSRKDHKHSDPATALGDVMLDGAIAASKAQNKVGKVGGGHIGFARAKTIIDQVYQSKMSQVLQDCKNVAMFTASSTNDPVVIRNEVRKTLVAHKLSPFLLEQASERLTPIMPKDGATPEQMDKYRYGIGHWNAKPDEKWMTRPSEHFSEFGTMQGMLETARQHHTRNNNLSYILKNQHNIGKIAGQCRLTSRDGPSLCDVGYAHHMGIKLDRATEKAVDKDKKELEAEETKGSTFDGRHRWDRLTADEKKVNLPYRKLKGVYQRLMSSFVQKMYGRMQSFGFHLKVLAALADPQKTKPAATLKDRDGTYRSAVGMDVNSRVNMAHPQERINLGLSEVQRNVPKVHGPKWSHVRDDEEMAEYVDLLRQSDDETAEAAAKRAEAAQQAKAEKKKSGPPLSHQSLLSGMEQPQRVSRFNVAPATHERSEYSPNVAPQQDPNQEFDPSIFQRGAQQFQNQLTPPQQQM